MTKLIKSYIDSLKIEEKSYEVWDSEIKGFGCMVHPSGRKTYYFLYRYKSPKKQRIKVGIHGNITCEIAREIVRGWAGDLARGIDPKEHSKKQEAEEKKSIKFSQFFCLFTEKYRTIHHAKSTLNRDEYRIKLHILPFFGQNTLKEITVRDILNFKDFLKHIPGTFNKCFTLLHKAFGLAELWGYREKNSNPCHGVQKYPERKMERFLKKDELRRLEEIIKLEEIYRLKSPYVLAAIRILIYTGCRMGEILTLKWEDIHLEENYIHIKKSKTGEKIVPLNKASKNVIKTIERREGNPYVFCSDKPGTHVVNIQESWRNIRKSAALSDVRIHDLRHSFASFAINNGLDLFQISKLLGHKNIQTTMRYAHITKENLIKSANIVGEVFGE